MYLTEKGLEKLKEELIKLKGRRGEVAERIKTAREFGDLSENSEYEDARNEQSFVEGRIEDLQDMIKNAKVLKKSCCDKVGLGSVVTLKIDGETLTYELVGANESDPGTGKISVESPIGHSLMDHSRGETIDIHLPSGKMSCEIIEIK